MIMKAVIQFIFKLSLKIPDSLVISCRYSAVPCHDHSSAQTKQWREGEHGLTEGLLAVCFAKEM